MNKNIFLIDSLGALTSAISLCIIPYFQNYLGISNNITGKLIFFPLIFSVFSFLAYKLGNQKWGLLLKIIAIANLLYCCLTLLIVFKNFTIFTSLGIVYFIFEIFIILILATIELRIAQKKGRIKNDF